MGSREDLSPFQQARIRVIRRATYGLNTGALREGLVAPEGPFDTALANGLAAIIAAKDPGAEYGQRRKSGALWVLPPLKLVEVAERLCVVDSQLAELARSGIELTQPYRHGSADDEWLRVARQHIEALEALDRHDGLCVLDTVSGMRFSDAIVRLWSEEVDEELPFNLKDRASVPDVMECPDCWRHTLYAPQVDDFGMFPGEGRCLACGYERTYEDTIMDMMQWQLSRGD